MLVSTITIIYTHGKTVFPVKIYIVIRKQNPYNLLSIKFICATQAHSEKQILYSAEDGEPFSLIPPHAGELQLPTSHSSWWFTPSGSSFLGHFSMQEEGGKEILLH